MLDASPVLDRSVVHAADRKRELVLSHRLAAAPCWSNAIANRLRALAADTDYPRKREKPCKLRRLRLRKRTSGVDRVERVELTRADRVQQTVPQFAKLCATAHVRAPLTSFLFPCYQMQTFKAAAEGISRSLV